ncbi:MAG: hypothetical protein ABW051_11415 [Burkholderiaceae bacterium]
MSRDNPDSSNPKGNPKEEMGADSPPKVQKKRTDDRAAAGMSDAKREPPSHFIDEGDNIPDRE